MSENTDEDDTTVEKLLNSIPNETLGLLVKHASDISKMQNAGRVFIQRFLQRNAIFTGKVQADNRVTVPATEVEKLDLEKGDLVQVVLTPIEDLPEGVQDDTN